MEKAAFDFDVKKALTVTSASKSARSTRDDSRRTNTVLERFDAVDRDKGNQKYKKPY